MYLRACTEYLDLQIYTFWHVTTLKRLLCLFICLKFDEKGIKDERKKSDKLEVVS
jgi:hypothetical protein